jgi:Large polyvalent protein-associated domain 7
MNELIDGRERGNETNIPDVRQPENQSSEKEVKGIPDAGIDDDALARVAATRQRDTESAKAVLAEQRIDPVNENAVADLNSRMEKAHLREEGWRDRNDIADIMRDLEVLAAKDWNRAAELWDKHVPNEIDKPVFIDGDDIDEKKSAKSASKESADDEKSPTPESIKKRFLQAENKFYFRDQENKLAFEESGRSLVTKHDTPEVAQSMVELAEHKGWSSIKLKGTDEFKREVWLQASLKGIDVQGYQPKDVDLAKLADMQKEPKAEPRAKEEKANSIAPTPERSFTKPSAERAVSDTTEDRPLSKEERKTVEVLKSYLRSKDYPEKTVNVVAEEFATKIQSNRVYVGELADRGEAPYQHDPKNENSYYVKLKTESGDKEVWGADLKRALDESAVKVGDSIAIAQQSEKPVTVQAKERDESGKIVAVKEIGATKNEWKAYKIDNLREDTKEQLVSKAKTADRQPLVKVYDRDAERNDVKREVARDKPREKDNDRVRG